MLGPRSQARRYAVLALYQWQLTGQDPAEIGRHFFDDPAWAGEVAGSLAGVEEGSAPGELPEVAYDRELFEQLLQGVPLHQEDLDTRLQAALDRPLSRVDPVERAILRTGAFELINSPQIPVRVIINEAVDLARLLGAEQGHRFVNGVLDRLARLVRADEFAGTATPGGRGSA
jgi:N utilization substance protein B